MEKSKRSIYFDHDFYQSLRPSDYLEGEIKVKGNVVSKITGTFLGWLEVDGVRYFDYRHLAPFKVNNKFGNN